MDTRWPDLDVPDFGTTMETLQLWVQVVGKVKLAAVPWLNESWHVPLYVGGSGITTGLMTYSNMGFELAFDFLASELRLEVSDGGGSTVPLRPMSVADFHSAVLDALAKGGIDLAVTDRPSEIAGAIPFADDTSTRTFDLEAARAWWRATIQAQRVFHRFRSRFVGKCSPIHLFWGAFDLAVTRFSGRDAPLATHGAPNMSLAVAQDAYDQEQFGCGFSPGTGGGAPSFYLEPWPEPGAYASAKLRPPQARYDEKAGRWLLDYAAVRASDDPDAALMGFLQTGYAAVADANRWPRERLERDEGPIGRPPPLGRS